MESEEIKKSLSRTWWPFFSRFGRLTEVQRKTIPLVLQRKNIVVISPSATGKTEAVLAPLCEIIPERSTPSILYVSPTRALVNDVYRRLKDPLSMLGLRAGRRTGELKEGEKKGIYIIITTPESFDAMLARNPVFLKKIEAVVLDEIHLLDGTPRGDMLRVLMNRLRFLIRRTPLTCVLSATIDRPEIGGRYMDDYEVVNVRGEREIEYVLMKETPTIPSELVRIFTNGRFKKVIVFFNSRLYAETFSKRFSLPPFEGKVVVHHGSLVKGLREDAEGFMHTSRIGIICATTTLELGIDIGDIDCVVLYRPPPSISSLLQRIGRGNRRRNDILFAIGVYENRWERELFEIFFQCAKSGRLYGKKYNPIHTILPQQVFSYSFQKKRTGVTKNGFMKLFKGIFKEDEVNEFLEWALTEGFLQEGRGGVLHLTSKLENMIKYGRVHTIIMDFSPSSYEVIDVETGRKLGDVFYPQEQFVFAGKTWTLVELDRKRGKAFVRETRRDWEMAKLFEGVGFGTYSYELSGVLRSRFFKGLKERDIPYARTNNCEVIVAHFFGSIYSEILSETLSRQYGMKFHSPDGIITFFRGEPHILLSPEKTILREVIADTLLKLQDVMGVNGFFRLLPRYLQIMGVWNALDVDGFLDYLSTLSFKEYGEVELKEVLSSLSDVTL